MGELLGAKQFGGIGGILVEGDSHAVGEGLGSAPGGLEGRSRDPRAGITLNVNACGEYGSSALFAGIGANGAHDFLADNRPGFEVDGSCGLVFGLLLGRTHLAGLGKVLGALIGREPRIKAKSARANGDERG